MIRLIRKSEEDNRLEKVRIYQVDAFADAMFEGNPAAVCILTSWPHDHVLQSIAAENNLSETAFVVGEGGRYRLRWFTPKAEVDLCGHATLAASHVIFEYEEPGLNAESSYITFLTLSGELYVRRHNGSIMMNFPSDPPKPITPSEVLLDGLGAKPSETLSGAYLMAVYESENQVRELDPKLDLIASIDNVGVIATAPGDQVDFVSRFFAPRVGVPEDPVTGSAHTILTPYLAERLGKTKLQARQISARGGSVECHLENGRVLLYGKAVLYMKGEIEQLPT